MLILYPIAKTISGFLVQKCLVSTCTVTSKWSAYPK